ncbi:MAG: histidine kinase [Chitinophagaceae bacterium]|nr:histidine kinase [Chitinophagaceae bacterium]HQV60686.1 histidine kinase [Chitinophagaceae bacterium]HQV86270.1 histidine kinase [Chitinophagaceae bacterium]HQX72888.1 histidine kinase [Chitinophagaceae bacterium]HQZ73088.1 histidine kinase [Chitinophagaceae bacterium]
MSNSPLSILRFKVIFIICWLVIITDQAIALNFFGLPWQAAIIDSLICNALLLLACLLIMHTLRYYLPRGQQYINIFSICIFLSILWLILSKWLLKLSLGHYPGYTDMLHQSLSIRFSIGFLLLGCITMISILWYNQQEQKEKDTRKTDAEKLAKEAELFKLRQQLQPHFLFNSLNSINALIGSRPEEARKMVQQLSDFLRGTIKKEETQWVTLQEELQYLQLYLDIEKVRFGNRLATDINIDENTQSMKLPALLLQPIVENAIKFGLYDTTGETVIRLYASREENNLVIRVMNPFDPETSSPKQGIGFGLKSVQRRLYLLFARTDLLSTEAKENIFITVVKIPETT